MDPPIFIAIRNANGVWMDTLVASLVDALPENVYVHVSEGLSQLFEHKYGIEDHGKHFIMELAQDSAFDFDNGNAVEMLSIKDFDALRVLYEASYPGNWFRRHMLENGPYAGVRSKDGDLLSAGGAHVYSPRYGVATLGNIVTHPDHRGEGLGKSVSAKLCQVLGERVDTIGLNVRADNEAAIHIYEKLGFQKLAEYWEMTMHTKALTA